MFKDKKKSKQLRFYDLKMKKKNLLRQTIFKKK